MRSKPAKSAREHAVAELKREDPEWYRLMEIADDTSRETLLAFAEWVFFKYDRHHHEEPRTHSALNA